MSRVGGLLVIVSFLSVAYTPLPNLLARWRSVPSRVAAAEAIVVLGGGIEDGRTLSLVSLRRTVHGIRLYRQGLAPLMIFSGGTAGQGAAEGPVMALLAVELGIPSDAIWVETQSNDTRTEALEVARLVRPKQVRKILLVTDAVHMKRASTAFQRVGFEVLAAPAETVSANARTPEGRLYLMHQVSREALARLYYWVRERL